jgi:hypothetical protein
MDNGISKLSPKISGQEGNAKLKIEVNGVRCRV